MAEPAPTVDEGLSRNFRFLVLEVIKQVASASRVLAAETEIDIGRLSSRDDYIDHLRTRIENQCFTLLRVKETDKRTVDFLRSTTTVTSNLERIADHAVSIATQAGRLEPRGFLARYEFQPFFEVIFSALERVIEAYESRDTDGAVRIADGELTLDELYRDRFGRLLADLEQGGDDVPNQVTALLIFHYLERIGDCLQNIGEAIIFAQVGERLKMRAFRELSGQLDRGTAEPSLTAVSFEGIWNTRSGAQIGVVKTPALAEEGAIFKHGEPGKMRSERAAIERWSQIAPGLAPKVIGYRETEQRDSMLVEYLEGQTLLEIMMSCTSVESDRILGKVTETVGRLWTDTLRDEPVRPRFLRQLERRLEDVYLVHPYFRDEAQGIAGLHISSLSELVAASRELDQRLEAPFSVLGHGDFNLDNVIFNRSDRSVHFIDLHRSGYMDYVQDVTVFLVSNFRVPVFSPKRREPLHRSIEVFLDFARGFAEARGDVTFEARTAMGLARSFITSTRLDIRRAFAEEMLRRGLYLLGRLAATHEDELASFRLPKDVLVYNGSR